MTRPPDQSDPAEQALYDELVTLLDGATEATLLVTGERAGGQPFWAYVAMPPSRIAAFKRAEAAGGYDLAAFGRIIEHGSGDRPPLSVRNRMARDYGCDDAFEQRLASLFTPP